MGTERAQAVAVENEAKKTYTYSGLKFEKKVHFMKCFFRKSRHNNVCLKDFFIFFFLQTDMPWIFFLFLAYYVHQRERLLPKNV